MDNKDKIDGMKWEEIDKLLDCVVKYLSKLFFVGEGGNL